ncbi:hypothetical protein [Streptomyces netropsis]|uniref:Uncharacterized protein n=1 Tax=Streptomyces netropsis TaxID=55404 RepID=A0A7W7L7J7_STRNE|nr:hypothetical protein [Streptomyces netropsis]MBB4884533.1 hypothetical protein [Streptomyces netropsis]GGR02983.1 hypothetical protein GCM10010219_03770 [Streptomyces netropsis]
MNIRSLTRGDGVVIGAAVLLFIASFLDFYSVDCSGQFCDKSDLPNLWDSKLFPVLPTVVLAGIVGAVLIIAGRFQPQGRNLLGLTLDQWGTALTVFAAWSSLWTMFGGALEDNDKVGAGVGRILALIALLVMAAGALLTQRIPALKAPLVGAPAPQAPSPYGAGPGYGYPGPGGMQQGQAPYGAQQQPYGAQTGQTGQPQPQQDQPAPAQAQPAATQPAPAPAGDFAPFWFAVPVARPLYGEDGSPTQIAELAPGTWYLAVDQRGQALVAQTQDGRRGVLQDTTGIQRG